MSIDDSDGKKSRVISSPNNESQDVSMIEFATPASDVSAFCRAVLCSLIPNGFWGVGKQADANQKVILQHVDRFIHLRRFENLSLHVVSQQMKAWGSCANFSEHQADVKVAKCSSVASASKHLRYGKDGQV